MIQHTLQHCIVVLETFGGNLLEVLFEHSLANHKMLIAQC